jgi:hypothetical protein
MLNIARSSTSLEASCARIVIGEKWMLEVGSDKNGTLRQFAAAQQFDRFRSKVDIMRRSQGRIYEYTP